jgi:C1A family cysteine protease
MEDKFCAVLAFRTDPIKTGVSFDLIKPKFTPIVSDGSYSIPDFSRLLNQSFNDCTCNAVCDALEILMSQNGGVPVELSRLFCYWNARELNGETNKDEGTYIRSVFEGIRKFGVCPESAWTYEINKIWTKPNLEAYKTGNDNQISGCYRITSSESNRAEDFEAAIRFDHPVVLGIPVDNAFINHYQTESVLNSPRGNIIGRHAIIVVGVRRNASGEQEFQIKNSWGIRWGSMGHAWLSYDYMIGYSEDPWIVTVKPDLVL